LLPKTLQNNERPKFFFGNVPLDSRTGDEGGDDDEADDREEADDEGHGLHTLGVLVS
jgi:hypothetical protein